MTKNTNSKRRYGIEDKNCLVSVIEIWPATSSLRSELRVEDSRVEF